MFGMRYPVVRAVGVSKWLLSASALAILLVSSVVLPESVADPVDTTEATNNPVDPGELIVPIATPETAGESLLAPAASPDFGATTNSSGGGGPPPPANPGTAFPVEMVTVTTQTPCNPADSATGSTYGRVCYPYQIGKYEITNWQYAAFLNAVATASDPHELWESNMGSMYGIHRNAGVPPTQTFNYTIYTGYQSYPAAYMTESRVMRFCNWLHNNRLSGSDGAASTEYGAYDLSSGASPVRQPTAKWGLPTENEWYKAAYYSPNGGTTLYPTAGYYPYPTGTSVVYRAVYSLGSCNRVGYYSSYPSPWGTFDQAGNVDEITSPVVLVPQGAVFAAWGGSYSSTQTGVSAAGGRQTPSYVPASNTHGFRVVFLPDTDSDGVPDAGDNCPSTANGPLAGPNNQLDTDGDGVGDVCDDCPSDPLKTAPGECGCGTPDTDSNGDGIVDCLESATSQVAYTLELGGDNHTAQYEANTGFPQFTPGSAADGPQYTAGHSITWGVRVRVFGRHHEPGSPSDGLRTNGAACLAFNLELHQGAANGPLVSIGAGSASSPGWYSSINDGDADGVRGGSMGADPLKNAAFCSVFDVGGMGNLGGRLLDANSAGGPSLALVEYPSAYGRPAGADVTPGVLLGMGACYDVFDGANSTAGIGVSGTTAGGCSGLGELTLFEGQINTTGLTAGTYVLVLVPQGANVLLGTFGCQTSPGGCFSGPANQVTGDTITFELLP